ncbi:uncharacterized protein LOC122961894 [Acropora millepora]|uniref:uncharacterized protein LOC122961894 n=1 Tax=Acropora millepora TaxID=45264 RepID=UPI001CF2442C|nr:uncharacterized protein LOC122961894 [Acropora millepora]
MQEKSDVENNQPKSNECWAHVDESRSKNGNARRSQKSVRSNTTETRNSFEPLQRLNEALVDARNEDNRTANNDDRRFRRPSCRPTDVTTQSVNDNNTYDQADENNEAAHPSSQTTEKTETTDEHSANQSGTQQSKASISLLKWAKSEENLALQDVFCKAFEVSCMWTSSWRDFNQEVTINDQTDWSIVMT